MTDTAAAPVTPGDPFVDARAALASARSDAVAAALAPLAFSIPVRVYYEDTDAGGIVYHANYLRFLERARTDWLRALGAVHSRIAENSGAVFVVRDMTIDFQSPARLDDLLTVDVRVLEAKRARRCCWRRSRVVTKPASRW